MNIPCDVRSEWTIPLEDANIGVWCVRWNGSLRETNLDRESDGTITFFRAFKTPISKRFSLYVSAQNGIMVVDLGFSVFEGGNEFPSVSGSLSLSYSHLDETNAINTYLKLQEMFSSSGFHQIRDIPISETILVGIRSLLIYKRLLFSERRIHLSEARDKARPPIGIIHDFILDDRVVEVIFSGGCLVSLAIPEGGILVKREKETIFSEIPPFSMRSMLDILNSHLDFDRKMEVDITSAEDKWFSQFTEGV